MKWQQPCQPKIHAESSHTLKVERNWLTSTKKKPQLLDGYYPWLVNIFSVGQYKTQRTTQQGTQGFQACWPPPGDKIQRQLLDYLITVWKWKGVGYLKKTLQKMIACSTSQRECLSYQQCCYYLQMGHTHFLLILPHMMLIHSDNPGLRNIYLKSYMYLLHSLTAPHHNLHCKDESCEGSPVPFRAFGSADCMIHDS